MITFLKSMLDELTAIFANNDLRQILLNILGGAITVGLIELGRKIFSLLNRYKFKQVFGEDVLQGPKFYLVYAQLGLGPLTDERGHIITHPYTKPGEEAHGSRFSIQRPVSSCEVRAAKYLSEIIGAQAKQSPMLSSDYDLRGRLDISFVPPQSTGILWSTTNFTLSSSTVFPHA